jgi:hypothetical protein
MHAAYVALTFDVLACFASNGFAPMLHAVALCLVMFITLNVLLNLRLQLYVLGSKRHLRQRWLEVQRQCPQLPSCTANGLHSADVAVVR